jgi:hypothetical protein
LGDKFPDFLKANGNAGCVGGLTRRLKLVDRIQINETRIDRLIGAGFLSQVRF